MESPTRLRPRVSMPHVSSQWQSNQQQRGSYDSRLSIGKPKKSMEYLKPIAIPASRSGLHHSSRSPSMSLLATPENERWDFGSIRHIRQPSYENKTPTSAVESVFELPSASSYESANSSAHSSFVAELEDTSFKALRRQNPAVPTSPVPASPLKSPALSHSTMEFKSAEMTSRAVIKVVDETIAAIEDTNRKLLLRAVAAEEAANQLREQNSELESKLKQMVDRPKTAPSQPSNRTRHHHSPSSHSQIRGSKISELHDPTPLSTFNAQIDRLLLPPPPSSKRGSRPRDPPPQSHSRLHTKSQSLSTPISTLTYIDLAPSPGSTTGLSAPPKHHQRIPRPHPVPHKSKSNCHLRSLSHSQSNSGLMISSPIPGSVCRHEVTLAGTPISSSQRARAQNISLEEARRRAKPLPPLGPMSPSVLRGVVEIGPGGGRERDEWGRLVSEREAEGKKEKVKGGFSALFRWRKEREGTV